MIPSLPLDLNSNLPASLDLMHQPIHLGYDDAITAFEMTYIADGDESKIIQESKGEIVFQSKIDSHPFKPKD